MTEELSQPGAAPATPVDPTSAEADYRPALDQTEQANPQSAGESDQPVLAPADGGAVVSESADAEPIVSEPVVSELTEPELAESGVDSGTTDGGANGEVSEGKAPSGASPGTRDRGGLRKRLEEEGDVAADYLEELLDIADLDGDLDIDVENDRAAVSIVGDGVAQRSLRRLVGDDGQVLEALQELTRLAVAAKTGDRSRLMLDVAGFRAARRKDLEQLASEAVASVKAGETKVTLDPMTPFERKVVHDVVAAAGLVSESEGEGPQRHVVISAA